jgi:hypothetical protein
LKGDELRGRVHLQPVFRVRPTLERFDLAARRRRALRVALPLLGIALLVLPVPGLHLSAPLLLGAAFVLARRRLRETEVIRELRGECPCSPDAQRYELPERIALPLTLRCPACREFVTVERAEARADERFGRCGGGKVL